MKVLSIRNHTYSRNRHKRISNKRITNKSLTIRNTQKTMKKVIDKQEMDEGADVKTVKSFKSSLKELVLETLMQTSMLN